MRINVSDLPPAYQAQAIRKWAEQERRKRRPSLPCPAAVESARKYHNRPTERLTESGTVLRFDSQKEARRYDELAALEREGVIRDLRMQTEFTLQEAYTDNAGKRVRAIRYRADFTYRKQVIVELTGEKAWPLVVEDVKSRATRTKQYVMKRKMMKERFNIDIQEV